MDENKAAGLDNLSGKFLKDGATVLAKSISQICNLCIKYAVFPSGCKIVKLTPLFKKGSKRAPRNYCPISLQGVSYSQKFCSKCSFPKMANSRTSQFMFPKYLIEYQNVKIDSEIKI